MELRVKVEQVDKMIGLLKAKDARLQRAEEKLDEASKMVPPQ